MDINAIPRTTAVVLTGLDFTMKPEHVRHEADKGFIKPYPEIKVMHLIKALASMVYEQEKLMSYLHGNVCDGRNSLAYFVCAVHLPHTPQPFAGPSRHSESSMVSVAIEDPTSQPVESTAPGEDSNLPKLVATSMLPLGYWDSLWYAVIAEIRMLYADLRNRFGFDFGGGTEPLHRSGSEGITEQPITAIDLALMLENAWYALMDPRLVAALDSAVRARKVQEKDSQSQGQMLIDANKTPTLTTAPPGLIDVNALTPEAIMDMVWEKHAPTINQARESDARSKAMTHSPTAEQPQESPQGLGISIPSSCAGACNCDSACACRSRCEHDATQCFCKNSAFVYHLVEEQESNKAAITRKYVKQDRTQPNVLLGAPTNSMAQMQIAALANRDPVGAQACYSMNEASASFSRQGGSSATRPRKSTATSTNADLAYVPRTRTPSSATKGSYSLGLYGRDSGHRYPPIRPKPSMPSFETPTSVPSMPAHPSTIPARKPVPPPVDASWHSSYPYSTERGKTPSVTEENEPSSPMSSPLDTQTFAMANPTTYPESEAKGPTRTAGPAGDRTTVPEVNVPRGDANNTMLTQSFPGGPQANPRQPLDPAQDYVSLLSRHPSTLEASSPPVPTATSTISPPRPVKKKKSFNYLPTLRSLRDASSSPAPSTIPPVPTPQGALPSFIAPRPAVKQRYVSAGGTAKLSERAEIPPPGFIRPFASGGPAIPKDELDAKLNDPEWLREHFGAAAAGRVGGMSPPPPSPAPKKSGEGSARERGSSSAGAPAGTGGAVARLKRVFSRSNEDSGASG